MCGIFGFTIKNKPNLTKEDLKDMASILFKLSARRGHEATGLAIAHHGKISVYKQPTSYREMLEGEGFNNFLNRFQTSSASPGRPKHITTPITLIGHTRLVTSGIQVLHENNQPIISNHIVGVHNGIIANDDNLAKRHLPSKRMPRSDSTLLFELIDKFYSDTGELKAAISKVYSEILGSASIALFSDDQSGLTLATNTGSLYHSYNDEAGFFVFASEHYIVEQFLKKSILARGYDSHNIQCLNPATGAFVKFENVIPEIFQLKEPMDKQAPAPTDRKKNIYEIINASSPRKSLRHCTRCVLPETYPFISFDENGVCNYCRKYKKQEFLGYDALENILSKYRSKDGRPDCIVGFSGGRDSSYALHVLKTKLGMHPIAYTYDWGLVTDLARRNQARVTGKLGIEHLIRAADIHTKRRHIKKHIYAWLEKPELGMVPLFMAGDKMFYYYGGQLRKETGIKLTVFAAGQQLEQMEFKVGFCGIDEHLENNTKLYHFKLISKVRLALWYLKQYCLNPRYFNESFFDSAFAFYVSFLNKDDYTYLYRYIPWDEKVIERTLKEEYDWELDSKYGKNQWRMGDGQTAFTNYIYYAIAGFSEFDSFRSNQIREGLITREEAVELLKDDNRLRIGMLQDFSQLIGFNLEEVLLKINKIPKLYQEKK
ncbi:MAG: hypothetical protein HQ549_04610 [Candidatus Omnitrophica bacterium]|nr:hypothetical protein [Candidatus Omnitrophota bacterium]